jgi:hypothetical protein
MQIRAKQHYGKMVVQQMASVSLGEVRNSLFTNLGGNHYSVRAEFLPLGDFTSKGDYFQSDLKREPKPKLAFGLTYSYNDNAVSQTSTGRYLVNFSGSYLQQDLATVLADVVFKYKGFSASSEYANKAVVGDHLNHQAGKESTLIDSTGRTYITGHGFTMQAGYLLKSNFEIAARFSSVSLDYPESFKTQNEYTLGFSKYIVGHTLKMQADISYMDLYGIQRDGLRYRMQVEIGF